MTIRVRPKNIHFKTERISVDFHDNDNVTVLHDENADITKSILLAIAMKATGKNRHDLLSLVTKLINGKNIKRKADTK